MKFTIQFQLKSILILFVAQFIFKIVVSQVRSEKVNQFDKSIELTYQQEGIKYLNCPITLTVTIKNDDTTFNFNCVHGADRSIFMSTENRSSVKKFEILNSENNLVEIPKSYLLRSEVGVSPFGQPIPSFGNSEYGIGLSVEFGREFIKKIIGMRGYRINGVGEGFIFREDKKILKNSFDDLINLFLKDFPQFNY